MQTLGTPVSMMTIPGVVSASLGLGLLPLLGCLTDGGSQPHRRKKPAVVGAFCIAVLGLTLNLGGIALHTWEITVSATVSRPLNQPPGTASPGGPVTAGQTTVPAAPSHLQQQLSGRGIPTAPAYSTDVEDIARYTAVHPSVENPSGEKAVPGPVSSAQTEDVSGLKVVKRQGSSRESDPVGRASSDRVEDQARLPPVQITSALEGDPAARRGLLIRVTSSQAEDLASTPAGASPFLGGVGDWREGILGPFGNGSSRYRHDEATELSAGNRSEDNASVSVLVQISHLNHSFVIDSKSMGSISPDSFVAPDNGTDVSLFDTRDSQLDSDVDITAAEPGGVPTHRRVLGLPVTALLAMAGFVFMDLGFDLTNSAVKTCLLTHSVPADHVSLLIIGVFMSALGGCVTSVSGLLDLSSLLPGV